MERQQINLLILEDDFEAVAELMLALRKLKADLLPYQLVVTLYTDSESVDELVNEQPEDYFHVILLDRDCIVGGSFHCLDIEKFGAEKIISISSTPQWNKAAQERGINRSVGKSFSDLKWFAEEVVDEIYDLLQKNYGLLPEEDLEM